MAVTASDVLDIMDTTLTIVDVEPHLDTAAAFFADRLDGEGVSSTMQDEITKHLAAHFASVKDRRAEQVSVEGTSERYARLGQGLLSTDYGQIAVSLDPTGILAGLADDDGRRSFRSRIGGR